MLRLLSPTYWFGPLFHLELTRLARRGLHNPLRWGLGLILLVVLFAFYSRWFPLLDPISLLTRTDSRLNIQEMALFSESFVFALLMLQLGIVIALTPFLAAGSIVEERRKQTMEFLLMSPLTEREIVLGKLAARLVYVAAILFAVLPIMALMQFWGGIELRLVLYGYAVIGITLLSLGALSVYYAVRTDSLSEALWRVYGWLLLLTCGSFCCACCSPLAAIGSPIACLWIVFNPSYGKMPWEISLGQKDDPSLPMVLLFVVGHCILAYIFVLAAAKQLRNRSRAITRLSNETRDREAKEFTDLLRQVPSEATESDLSAILKSVETAEANNEPAVQRTVKVGRGRALADDDNPLAWKERNFPRGLDQWSAGEPEPLPSEFLTVIAVIIFLAIAMTMLSSAANDESVGPISNPVVRWIGIFLFATWCLTAAWRTVKSLTREREDQTLDSLLALPTARIAILTAKWRSGWERGKMVGRSLAILGAAGAVTAGIHLIALPLVVAFAFVFRLFLNTLGLWLSTVCRTTLRAQVWFVILLLAICIGPYLLAKVGSAVIRFQEGRLEAIAVEERIDGLSPIATWINLTFYWRDLETSRGGTFRQMGSAFLATACFLFMSGALWWDARRRFEKEGK